MYKWGLRPYTHTYSYDTRWVVPLRRCYCFLGRIEWWSDQPQLLKIICICRGSFAGNVTSWERDYLEFLWVHSKEWRQCLCTSMLREYWKMSKFGMTEWLIAELEYFGNEFPVTMKRPKCGICAGLFPFHKKHIPAPLNISGLCPNLPKGYAQQN